MELNAPGHCQVLAQRQPNHQERGWIAEGEEPKVEDAAGPSVVVADEVLCLEMKGL